MKTKALWFVFGMTVRVRATKAADVTLALQQGKGGYAGTDDVTIGVDKRVSGQNRGARHP
jgi:hypothetical protein